MFYRYYINLCFPLKMIKKAIHKCFLYIAFISGVPDIVRYRFFVKRSCVLPAETVAGITRKR